MIIRWNQFPAAMVSGELFIPELTQGQLYKYAVRQHDGELAYKADPYGFYSEVKPKTASIIWELDGYDWQDRPLVHKKKRNRLAENADKYLWSPSGQLET